MLAVQFHDAPSLSVPTIPVEVTQPTTTTPTVTPTPATVEPWYKDPLIWVGVGLGAVAVGVTSWAAWRALR